MYVIVGTLIKLHVCGKALHWQVTFLVGSKPPMWSGLGCGAFCRGRTYCMYFFVTVKLPPRPVFWGKFRVSHVVSPVLAKVRPF